MTVQWLAKTLDADYTSTKNAYRDIPQQSLRGFCLEGFGRMLEVNLLTGELFIDGVNAESGDNGALTVARKSQGAPFKLHYHQRGFRDMNPKVLSEYREGIEYAVCGWESDVDRVYWKVMPNGRAFLHFEKV
jgi:hypothetical protein